MPLVVSYDPKAVMFERPVGLQQAVVIYVTDLGQQADPFKEGNFKQKVAVTWMLGVTYDYQGKTRPCLQTEMYTMSLAKKAKLRMIIEGMLGKSLSTGDDEVFKFDLETLIGAQCMLTLQKKNSDEPWTSVIAAAPLMKNLPALTVVPIELPTWIIEMKFHDSKKVDPLAPMSDATMAAIMAQV